MPRVSILLPTYEPSPAHLRQALQGILAQTITDWELIVCDDCSMVNVLAVLGNLANDPRIRFHRSDHRLGIGRNWNACLQRATGEFVAYCFQDDVWHEQYLERAIAALNRYPSAGFAALQHHYGIEGENAFAGQYRSIEQQRARLFQTPMMHGNAFLRSWLLQGLHPNVIGEPSFVVLRKSAADRIGSFTHHLVQGLDAEYWTRALYVSDIAFVAEESGTFRVHPAGASAIHQQERKGMSDRLRILLRLSIHPATAIYAWIGIAKSLPGMVGKYVRRRF